MPINLSSYFFRPVDLFFDKTIPILTQPRSKITLETFGKARTAKGHSLFEHWLRPLFLS